MVKGEKLYYQENKLAYSCVIGFIILNVATTILTLRSMTIDFYIGIFTMYNIMLTLISFLAAVKLKKYSSIWAIIALIISFIQFIRCFKMPELKNEEMSLVIIVMMLVSAVLLLLSGIITLTKAKVRENYMNYKNE